MDVLRHARILRRAPRGRKAAGFIAETRCLPVLGGLALGASTFAAGCLGDPRGVANADVSESDVTAIETTGEACLPQTGAACAGVDLADPCAAPVDWVLVLNVERSGCDVPGADVDAVGLPESGSDLDERPAFTLGGAGGPDLLVDPSSLLADAAALGATGDPTLVFRAALGAFNPARCAWPFELGWYRDTPGGTRQIVRLHGILNSDGTATGTGERRDESVHFACSSDLRITRDTSSR